MHTWHHLVKHSHLRHKWKLGIFDLCFYLIFERNETREGSCRRTEGPTSASLPYIVDLYRCTNVDYLWSADHHFFTFYSVELITSTYWIRIAREVILELHYSLAQWCRFMVSIGGDNLQFYSNFAQFSTLGGMNLDHGCFQASKLSEDQKKGLYLQLKNFCPRI